MFDAAIDHRTRHCHSQPGHFALTATADVRSHQARAAQPQTARLQLRSSPATSSPSSNTDHAVLSCARARQGARVVFAVCPLESVS